MTLFRDCLKLKHIIHNENGQGMVEYVLIIAFIALVVILSLTEFGRIILQKYESIQAYII